ncbi:hypothetical protein YPPY89_2923, partial [Yersinia pestis PY-89]
MKVSIT